MSLTTSFAEPVVTAGYEQQLRRGVGTFASFAAGFSFVSILATVFQLFGLEVYDLTGQTWWLQWSALLFIGLSLAVGAVYFVLRRLHRHIELTHVPHTHFHASAV